MCIANSEIGKHSHSKSPQFMQVSQDFGSGDATERIKFHNE